MPPRGSATRIENHYNQLCFHLKVRHQQGEELKEDSQIKVLLLTFQRPITEVLDDTLSETQIVRVKHN